MCSVECGAWECGVWSVGVAVWSGGVPPCPGGGVLVASVSCVLRHRVPHVDVVAEIIHRYHLQHILCDRLR